MKRTILLAILLACGLAQADEPAPQQSKPIPTVVIGMGKLSCGQFIEYEKQASPDDMDLIVEWVWGYLVAYNHRGFFNDKAGHAVNQLVPPDSPTVLLFIDGYCKRQPLSSVLDATVALIHSLGGPIVSPPDAAAK